MTPHNATRALAMLAAGLLLTACSNSGTQTPAASPTPATSSPTATGSPSPTSTLTVDQQEAVTQAVEAVRAYSQTFIDILADPTPRLNDINDVSTQPQLDIDLKALSELVNSEDRFVYTSTGPVSVPSYEVLKVRLDEKVPTIVLAACVDRTAVRGTQNGEEQVGGRELLEYTVVKTTYLPAPGWAVSDVQPPTGYTQPQPC